MAYYRFHGVKTRIVRIFNTYGPRMRLNDGRVLPAFMGQVLRGEPMSVYGKGDQTRSFCYVTDLVDGIYRLLHADFNEPVNIGNPSEITVLELAREIIAMVPGTKSTIAYEPLPQDDPRRRRPDITRAQALLGWNPTIDRADGAGPDPRILPDRPLTRGPPRPFHFRSRRVVRAPGERHPSGFVVGARPRLEPPCGRKSACTSLNPSRVGCHSRAGCKARGRCVRSRGC